MEWEHSSYCPASSSTVLARKALFSVQPSYSQESQRAVIFPSKYSASLHPGRRRFVLGHPWIIPAPSILRSLVQGLKRCPKSVVSLPLPGYARSLMHTSRANPTCPHHLHQHYSNLSRTSILRMTTAMSYHTSPSIPPSTLPSRSRLTSSEIESTDYPGTAPPVRRDGPTPPSKTSLTIAVTLASMR